MPTESRNILPFLGILIVVLIPASAATTVRGELPWYHGLAVFYGALSVAEIGYLTILLALDRAQRPDRCRVFP